MDLKTALSKLDTLEETMQAYRHAMGVLSLDGATAAPKSSALGRGKTFGLLCSECLYSIHSAYLLAFARSIAEVGAVSMVGGAISWKTNVMTTAIMQYTNRGNFSLGIALGMILLAVSLLVNIVISVLQRRLSR